MAERRFTDREVARILERATDLERSGAGPGASAGLPSPRGLTVAQLQEIGTEAGIDPSLIARAAAEVGARGSVLPVAPLGSPPVHRELRSVPARLSRDALSELVRLVDERVPAQGTVTEALGTVRWSARDRHLHRQVSLEPGTDETLIRVEERWTDRIRAVVHGLPTAWGAMFGLPLGGELLGGGIAWIVAPVFLAAVGFVLGRLVWEAMARRSGTRTWALAEEIAGVASAVAAGYGATVSEGGPDPSRPHAPR